MADTYEKWRDADRRAHEMELHIRGCGPDVSNDEIVLARQLRAEADTLFQAAIRDMHAKVDNLLASWPPRAGGGTTSTRV
jgi:hypothetical protein